MSASRGVGCSCGADCIPGSIHAPSCDTNEIELIECVVCHRLVDSDEANCPDRGWMCESCFDRTYGEG